MNVFNQCNFVGRAGSDAKLLTTSAGCQFLKFCLGVSDYSGKDEDTLWLTVLVGNSKQTEVEVIAHDVQVLVRAKPHAPNGQAETVSEETAAA